MSSRTCVMSLPSAISANDSARCLFSRRCRGAQSERLHQCVFISDRDSLFSIFSGETQTFARTSPQLMHLEGC